MGNLDLNKKEKLINKKKNLYFLIGFIVGIVPFILVISIINSINSIHLNTQLFKNTIILIGIIISISNAFILRFKITKHLENLAK